MLLWRRLLLLLQFSARLGHHRLKGGGLPPVLYPSYLRYLSRWKWRTVKYHRGCEEKSKGTSGTPCNQEGLFALYVQGWLHHTIISSEQLPVPVVAETLDVFSGGDTRQSQMSFAQSMGDFSSGGGGGAGVWSQEAQAAGHGEGGAVGERGGAEQPPTVDAAFKLQVDEGATVSATFPFFGDPEGGQLSFQIGDTIEVRVVLLGGSGGWPRCLKRVRKIDWESGRAGSAVC